MKSACRLSVFRRDNDREVGLPWARQLPTPCDRRPAQGPGCWHDVAGRLTRGWASHNIACGGYFMQNKFNKPIVFAMNSNCEFEINASALFFSSLHMENQDLQLTIY